MTRNAATRAQLRTAAEPVERVTARHLQAGDVLTRWPAPSGGTVTVRDVVRLDRRRWLVSVVYLRGAVEVVEVADFAAGELVTRRA